MRVHFISFAQLTIFFVYFINEGSESFSFSSHVGLNRMKCQRLLASPLGDEGLSAAKKNQEMKMESSSFAGAKAIAKLDLSERTKRALLAEAVEDRIFELVDELERAVAKNNGVLEGKEKEEAVELARQTKALQQQYDDLVNGRPSSLLGLSNGD